MKKQLLILTILASILPIAANADTPKMSQEAINTTISKYGKIYCTEGINALKDAVKQCYKDTPVTSPELDQCILADQAMTSIATNVINKNYADLYGFGAKDPSARDPYMTIDIEQTRVAYYTRTPRFKKDPELSKMDKYALYNYFPFFGSLPELFTKQCPINN